MPPRVRKGRVKYDGKIYKFLAANRTKIAAKLEAKILREHGHRARVRTSKRRGKTWHDVYWRRGKRR